MGSLNPQPNPTLSEETVDTLFCQPNSDEYERRCQLIISTTRKMALARAAAAESAGGKQPSAKDTGWIYRAWADEQAAKAIAASRLIPHGELNCDSYEEFLDKLEKFAEENATSETADTKSGASSAMNEDHFTNVCASLKFLIGEVEVNVEKYARIGAQAFRNRDMSKVEELRVKAEDESKFMLSVSQLYDDWSAMNDVRLTVRELIASGEATPFIISSVSLRRPIGVDAAIDTASEAVELTLDLFARCGERSFETREFDGVDRFRKLSLSLMQFQIKLEKLTQDWKRFSTDRDLESLFKGEVDTMTDSIPALKPTPGRGGASPH